MQLHDAHVHILACTLHANPNCMDSVNITHYFPSIIITHVINSTAAVLYFQSIETLYSSVSMLCMHISVWTLWLVLESMWIVIAIMPAPPHAVHMHALLTCWLQPQFSHTTMPLSCGCQYACWQHSAVEQYQPGNTILLITVQYYISDWTDITELQYRVFWISSVIS